MGDLPGIQTFGASDLSDLHALSQVIGWGHTLDDWRTILDIGRVIGHRVGGDLVSSAAVFEFGDALVSVGMVLVTPAQRGQGLARALMRECLEMCGTRPATLIATAQGEPLYRTLGFVEVERMCRIFVSAKLLSGPKLPAIAPHDRPDVTRLDADAFGADRGAMLRAYLARAEASALVRNGGGTVTGFGVAMNQGGRRVIGPAVARDSETALAIFRSLAIGYDGDLRIEIPNRQTRVQEALIALGGRRADDSPVMLHGGTAMPGRRELLHALASRGLG